LVIYLKSSYNISVPFTDFPALSLEFLKAQTSGVQGFASIMCKVLYWTVWSMFTSLLSGVL
jgi:hypothetical protein